MVELAVPSFRKMVAAPRTLMLRGSGSMDLPTKVVVSKRSK